MSTLNSPHLRATEYSSAYGPSTWRIRNFEHEHLAWVVWSPQHEHYYSLATPAHEWTVDDHRAVAGFLDQANAEHKAAKAGGKP